MWKQRVWSNNNKPTGQFVANWWWVARQGLEMSQVLGVQRGLCHYNLDRLSDISYIIYLVSQPLIFRSLANRLKCKRKTVKKKKLNLRQNRETCWRVNVVVKQVHVSWHHYAVSLGPTYDSKSTSLNFQFK